MKTFHSYSLTYFRFSGSKKGKREDPYKVCEHLQLSLEEVSIDKNTNIPYITIINKDIDYSCFPVCHTDWFVQAQLEVARSTGMFNNVVPLPSCDQYKLGVQYKFNVNPVHVPVTYICWSTAGCSSCACTCSQQLLGVQLDAIQCIYLWPALAGSTAGCHPVHVPVTSTCWEYSWMSSNACTCDQHLQGVQLDAIQCMYLWPAPAGSTAGCHPMHVPVTSTCWEYSWMFI